MATKIVYQLGNDGVYVGTATAYESPLEPGVFHVPLGCVKTAPPAFEAGQTAVWSDGAWTILSDHRGETWFDETTPVVIDFVGDPANRGYIASAPTPMPSLDDLRATAKADVDAAAEAFRLIYITSGSGQAMAYTQKLEEAKAYLGNNSLSAAECPHIFAEVGITGETAEAVAQVVVGMHAAWQIKSAKIEHKRLAAKAAIGAAETAKAISVAAQVNWET